MRWTVPVGPGLWIRAALVASLLISVATMARISAAPAEAEIMEIEQANLLETPLGEQLPAPVLEGPTPQSSLGELEYWSALSEFPEELAEAPGEDAWNGEGALGDPADDETSLVRSSVTSRGGVRPSSAARLQPSLGDITAAVARQYEGFRYSWGGASPQTGFDCSGFMWYVYREAGNPLSSRNLWGMINTGPSISQEELLPGDLVFFENTYTYGLSHGGIYLGDNQFIHAVTEGVGVKIDPLRGSGWGAHYAGASRPWQP